MLLNSNSVVHYLLQRGFLTFDSVVDGDLMVVEAPRRNRNFKLFRQRSPGLFVKQAQQWDAQAVATVQREGGCYALAASLPELASLLPLLPRFVFYDSARHVLVTELLSGHETLAEHHQRLRKFPLPVAEALAKALGTCHRETRDKLAAMPQTAIFPRTVPWALAIHLQQPEWFQSLSAANSQLLQLIKRYDQFATTLDQLRAQWSYSSLIHGDIKWDNCLVRTEPETGTAPAVKVVDWELADLGDPLWDVAAILQSYLSHWIFSMPVSPGTTVEQMIARSPWPLEVFQAAMLVFWKKYREVACIPVSERKNLLLRSISYAAARMIQTAYESLSFATQVNPIALYLLQVSMNILLDPVESAAELFGIEEADAAA